MKHDTLTRVTGLLKLFSEGDGAASEELLLLIHDELRLLAKGHMRREREDHTLQPTALVNELWAKMVAMEAVPIWPSRGHFYKWTSKAMGNLLRDHARRKNSQKAGGDHFRITLEASDLIAGQLDDTGMLDILDALEQLSKLDAELASIVELRAFGGFSYAEIADTLECSEREVDRSLQAARSWLRHRLDDGAA